MPRRRIRALVVLLVAVFAAVAAAVALGAIPDSNGVIHGCYTTATGSLRVVNASSECFVTETALDWGQQGPPGATGAQGPAGADGVQGATGAQGPQGLIGPSDAFASSTVRAMRLRRSLKTLERLDLDAGAHVLVAKVAVSQRARRSTRVVCTLRVGTGVDRSTVLLVPAPAAATVHLLLAADPGAPAAALVRCRHYSPASARVFAANVQLTAIKLSALTVQ
jgi:hypothetical protein